MRRAACIGLVLTAVCVGLPTATGCACVLSNRSSLSANGVTAVRNFRVPAGTLTGDAPFYFQRVYGQGQSIDFAENTSELHTSLTSAELQYPFLWRWGDGTHAVGTTAAHRYTGVGSYTIDVYAFNPARPRANPWLLFDRVRVRIVPPGEVWRDNLGWTLLDAVGFTLHWGVRLLVGALALVVAYGFWDDWRGKRSGSVRWRGRNERRRPVTVGMPPEIPPDHLGNA